LTDRTQYQHRHGDQDYDASDFLRRGRPFSAALCRLGRLNRLAAVGAVRAARAQGHVAVLAIGSLLGLCGTQSLPALIVSPSNGSA
jgi:hypothetical protein